MAEILDLAVYEALEKLDTIYLLTTNMMSNIPCITQE